MPVTPGSAGSAKGKEMKFVVVGSGGESESASKQGWAWWWCDLSHGVKGEGRQIQELSTDIL